MSPAQLINDADLVIGVTQRSINDQLRVLYNTKTGKNPKDGKPIYLLHHEFVQHADSDENKVTLQLQVESPTVDLNAVPAPVPSDPIVKMSFHATSGYYNISKIVGNGDDERIEHEKKEIPSGTLSWLSHLDQQQIFALNDHNHPNAVNHIKKFLEDDFLVSSLFVRFEEAKMSESLEFTPDDTKVKVDDKMMLRFFNALRESFRGAMDGPDKNPYILGYTIKQNPNHPPTDKVILQPKDYRFSLKPYPKDSQLNMLNFYLFLQQPKPDAGNGQIDPSLVVSAGGDLVPFTDDGVLAISSATFQYKLIKDLMIDNVKDKFWLSTEYLDKTSAAGKDIGHPLKRVEYTETYNASEYKRYAFYRSDGKKEDNNWVMNVRFWWEITQELSIPYTSTLRKARDESKKLGPNDARNVVLNMYFNMISKLRVETCSHLGDDWADMGDISITFPYSVDITLSTADSGKWVSSSKATFPKKLENGNWDVQLQDHLSVWFNIAEAFKNGFNVLGFLHDILEIYKPLGEENKSTFTETLIDEINKGIQDISNKVITPAGNIFTSKGLDSDASGNIYTHLKYDTPRSSM